MSVRGAASRDGLSKGERPAVSLVAGTPADPPSLLKIPCCSIEGEHQKEGRLPSPPFRLFRETERLPHKFHLTLDNAVANRVGGVSEVRVQNAAWVEGKIQAGIV